MYNSALRNTSNEIALIIFNESDKLKDHKELNIGLFKCICN